MQPGLVSIYQAADQQEHSQEGHLQELQELEEEERQQEQEVKVGSEGKAAVAVVMVVRVEEQTVAVAVFLVPVMKLD